MVIIYNSFYLLIHLFIIYLFIHYLQFIYNGGKFIKDLACNKLYDGAASNVG